MSREEIAEIYQTLLARDYARELFADLSGLKRAGREYQARCPFHDDKTPSFSASTEEPVFYCHGCGRGGDWIDYLREKDGLPFREALEKLADAAGVTLRGGADREAWAREREKERSRADLLERVLKHFQEALFEPRGKETLAYLTARGYTPDEIKRMELGHYPGQAETAELLRKLDVKDPGGLFPYLGARDDYKAVIPYRGPLGDVKSLWGRLTRPLKDGEKEADKYKPHAGDAGKDTPFNLDRAKRSAKFRDSGELLAVEGYFGALAVRELAGIDNAIALGGSSITGGQLETLRKYKTRAIILALDGDKPGREGTERALETLAGTDIKAYVLELPEKPKGPDDFILAKDLGPEAFAGLYAGAKRGDKWRAGRLVEKYRNAQTDPERDRAKDEIIGIAETLDPVDIRGYGAELQALGLSLDEAAEWIGEVRGRRAAAELSRSSRTLLEQSLERVKQGGGLDLRKLEERIKDLRIEAEKLKARPSESLGEHLRAKHGRESKREPGELLGYRLNRFPDIAEKTDGIQPGFYFIGAYTNRGKTALATNLFLDLLKSNPAAAGLYVSLDDNRDVIINRFLGILTGLFLNDVQRKAEGEAERKIKGAYDELIGLADKGRLTIKDVSEISEVSTLEIEVRQRAAGPLVVFIDGLYNLETSGDYDGIREANIERAQRIKALADAYKIPIIATGELRKRAPGAGDNKPPSLDDVMETGKFAYNANVVWLLFPQDDKLFEEMREPVLVLKYAKNKLSSFQGRRELNFNKATGALVERGKGSAYED